jgi:hypothetical protein
MLYIDPIFAPASCLHEASPALYPALHKKCEQKELNKVCEEPAFFESVKSACLKSGSDLIGFPLVLNARLALQVMTLSPFSDSLFRPARPSPTLLRIYRSRLMVNLFKRQLTCVYLSNPIFGRPVFSYVLPVTVTSEELQEVVSVHMGSSIDADEYMSTADEFCKAHR